MDLTKSQIVNYLTSKTDDVFFLADKVREKCVGNEVFLRGLIEISNFCKRDCFYCGIRNSNKECDRYRLSSDEILTTVEAAVELGYKTIVLQGGEDAYFTKDKMCDIIKEIKKYDVALTLSLGEKSYEEYKAYKDCGADRYLLRIETTDKALYLKMHPNMDLNNRILCLKNLKELGYELGTGILIGLPNQTIESIANDILFFKEIQADMIGVGPFIPCANTPLENQSKGSADITLRVMAITRILLENINIPATTALETIIPDGRILGLKAGANVIMPNVTDEKYKKLYKIYPNKSGITETAKNLKDSIEAEIISIGRKVSKSKGFRSNKKY